MKNNDAKPTIDTDKGAGTWLLDQGLDGCHCGPKKIKLKLLIDNEA